jgi:GNAT superfamily N-acetyltransferase
MEIKTYQPDELQTVLGIFSSYPKIFPEWERALLKKELLELNQNHLAFTCQIKGEIVGFTSFKKFEDAENSWCVNWLAVNNNHSRKGVATLLLKYVFDLAKSMKLKQVFVETCACADQLPARKAYESLGFVQCGLLPDYFESGHSKTIYQKTIE